MIHKMIKSHTHTIKSKLFSSLIICKNCSRTFRTASRLLFAANSDRKLPPFNIIFLGTDTFALETLKALHLNRFEGASSVVKSLQVVSTSSKSPVASFAESHNLQLLTWPLEPEFLDQFDVGVLVSFGKLVPKKVISALRFGILNVHPSLLPRWRGASPILHTLLSCDKQTGISIMSIQPAQFDTGPILKQKRFEMMNDRTAEDLVELLSKEGAKLLLETLQDMPSVLLEAKPQETEGVTYAHKMLPSCASINWAQHSCQQIQQQYKALAHALPLRTKWRDQPIRLQEMVLSTDTDFMPSVPPHTIAGVDLSGSVPPGTVVYDQQLQAVCVRCQQGWAPFRSVTLKKTMTAADFYNGYLSKHKMTTVQFTSERNGLFDQNYLQWVQQRKGSLSH